MFLHTVKIFPNIIDIRNYSNEMLISVGHVC